MSGRLLLVVGLALAVFASAVGNVYVKHLKRTLVLELHELQSDRDRMQIEWGQLQLEQSTWATHDRIREIADERLGLVIPSSDGIVLVVP